MITLYGIPNCDTIKKAKNWLNEHTIEFNFHDYRKNGVNEALVKQFCQQFGWQNVLNKRGTTYRQLTDEQKAQLDETSAIALLIEHPAMIKRPILMSDEHALIGFSDEQYQQAFFKIKLKYTQNH